jgi:hypothetical protein
MIHWSPVATPLNVPKRQSLKPKLRNSGGCTMPDTRWSQNLVMADRLVQAIVLVTDLPAAGQRLEALGLTVLEGGRHPGRGTANLIVPFGRQYLELLAIVDASEACTSPQGQPVMAALSSHGPGLARWSVEPDDIEATATRVGHPVEHRQRVRPDGTVVTWRSVAVDTAWLEPWRCAFMAWDDPVTHPARLLKAHPNGSTGFARLEVVVPDIGAAHEWLGGGCPPGVVMEVGPEPGPSSLCLSSPDGEIPVP